MMNTRDPSRRHFHELTHPEAVAALKRMHADGSSVYALAHCSGWSIEYLEQHVLGQHREREAQR